MDIKERSKQYAQGKALEAITAAIEKAYQDGYNDGLNHLALEEQEAAKTGVKYVDLGLPSGTLWSSQYITNIKGQVEMMPYLDASKHIIPTKQQFVELCEKCHYDYVIFKNFSGTKIIGPNGGEIMLWNIKVPNLKSIPYNGNSPFFWIQDDEENDKKNCATQVEWNKSKAHIEKIFMGLKLPVMLVK